MLEDPKFSRFKFVCQELLKLMGTGQLLPYSSFVTGIFDLYGKAQGKALIGNKTPGFVQRLYTLHGFWPTTRFVHLIRDGRDVCLSMADWPKAHQKRPGRFPTWKDDPVTTTAFWWELNVRLGRQAGKSLGPELYYELHYESLVGNPKGECASLCGFLGLPYDDSMLRFHEGKTRPAAGRDSKHAWLPVTPGLRDWRSQMPSDDVERFEVAAGELLDELGYPRAFPHPRPEAVERATRIRNLLARDPRWIRAIALSNKQPEGTSRTPDSLAEGVQTGGLSEGGP
jgi:hypothetical protein